MLQGILNLFHQNKNLQDDRIPVVLGSMSHVQGWFGRSTSSVYKISVVRANTTLHLQVVILTIIQLLLGVGLSLISYYWIILPRYRHQNSYDKAIHKSNPRHESTTPMSVFISGFGIVLPITLIAPFQLIDYFDIRCKALRFGCILLPVSLSLKCLVAMFGINDNLDSKRTTSQSTSLRTKSLHHFLYYMSFGLIPIYNKNYEHGPNSDKKKGRIVKMITREKFWLLLKSFYLHMLVLSLAFTILLPYNLQPFAKAKSNDYVNTKEDNASSVYPTLQLTSIYNNFMVAYVFYLTLVMGMAGVSMVVSLCTGCCQYDTDVFSGQPLLCSKSPSDFWGRRWNRLVHDSLKEGVYKPLMSNLTKRTSNCNNNSLSMIAKMATFLVSGLLHEYVMALLCYQNYYERLEGAECSTCYVPNYGKHTLFFLWNGTLLVLEDIIRNTRWFQRFIQPILHQYIPSFVVSHMVVLSALPVTHLFTDDMLRSGYFHGLQQMVPRLIIERQS